jgi:hypothetical protein
MQVRDVAFGQRHDAHAGEREPLEQARRVFLIAAEPVERFGQDDVELVPQRLAHETLKARAQERRARHGVVRVLACDLPALALRELAAHAELVRDRRVPLVIRGVAGVDGDFHR